MGRDVGIASYCQINAAGGIEIGDNVLIGPGALIWSQNHNYSRADIAIRDQGYTMAAVRIEDDVWIAGGAIVLPGAHLARGTVVAAGAVVNSPTEPYSVVGGIPARTIGRRGTA